MAEATKAMLVHAIIGRGFMSMEDAGRYQKIGLARFTGNQWNESWDWNQQALDELDEATIRSLLLKSRIVDKR